MKPMILAVDDDVVILDLISNVLDEHYCVAAVNSAQLAHRALSTKDIKLVLLDVEMPDTNGIEILKSIKADNIYKDLPVVMLTGNTSGSYGEMCIDLGADDILTKPINFDLLKKCIDRLMHGR